MMWTPPSCRVNSNLAHACVLSTFLSFSEVSDYLPLTLVGEIDISGTACNAILGFDVSISWALTKHSACTGYLL